MRLIFTLLFILITGTSVFSQSEFKIRKNKSKVVIQFKLINNLIFIPLKLNGEPLTFLLDTGVEETVLFSLSEINTVELKDVEIIKLKGLGGSAAIDGYKSSGNTVEINHLVDDNHKIYIVIDQDINFSSHVGIPVNGILGYHFFKNHLVEINYKKKKIYVYAKDNTCNERKLRKRFQKDSISLELNKPYVFKNLSNKGVTKHSKLLLDSGNSDAVWVFNNQQVKIPMPDKYLEDFLGRGFNGNVYGKRGRIDKIRFGGHEFKDALTNFPDSVSTQSVNFVDHRVGSIGGEILSRFTLFLDYPNSTIYTRPNSRIDDPFDFNMSGIEVVHAGLQWINEVVQRNISGIKVSTDSTAASAYKTTTDESKGNVQVHFKLIPIFKISNVRAKSEAEKVGLQIGDRIVKINNKNAEHFTIQKIHKLLKSEEGKEIEMEVERKGVTMNFKFKLKKIL
jgi:hypothetical protein